MLTAWMACAEGGIDLQQASALVVAAMLVLTLSVRRSATSIAANPRPAQLPALWSELFPAGGSTPVVLDDAALDLYQKATGHPVALTEYYDRSYLSSVEKTAVNAHFDREFVRSFLLRRQSSFAGANLVGRLAALAQRLDSTANVQFARDFSFHQLKSGNVILLGSGARILGFNPSRTHSACVGIMTRNWTPTTLWTRIRPYPLSSSTNRAPRTRTSSRAMQLWHFSRT